MHPVEALVWPLGRALRTRRPEPSWGLASAPQLQATAPLAVTSTAFADGAEIPGRNCGTLIGPNVSPPLAWGALPAGTETLLLILDDIDVPMAVPGIHMIAAFSPSVGALAEGALVAGASGISYLPRSFGGRPAGPGAVGYYGPRPLPGHGPHRYGFHLVALDVPLDLTAVADQAVLLAAVDGHVLAAGTLWGTRTC